MSSPAVVPALKPKANKKAGAQSTALAIQTVKAKGGGLVSMMAFLIGGRGIRLPDGSTFTVATLIAEWKQGGKEVLEGSWRQDANKPTGHSVPKADYDPENATAEDEQYEEEVGNGLHEWIPTNMLAYVVDCAIAQKDEVKALQWLMLAETLRIPTRFVMLRPPQSKPSAPGKSVASASAATTKPSVSLSGHVGALYLLDAKTGAYKQQTKGQGPFHDQLRAILKKNLSAQKSDIANYRKELLAYIQEAFWQGEASTAVSDADACPYFFNSGVNTYTSWGANMGAMRTNLAMGWATHNQILANTFAAVMPIYATNIPYSHSSIAMQNGTVFPGDNGMSGSAMDTSK